MRTLSTVATLLLGLAIVFWAPAAKAHCPGHAHCDGGGGKVVFVSSVDTFTGNLGGVAGADATCNILASDAGLSGDFKAWLGATGPLGSPVRRFPPFTGTYVLTDGTQVVQSYNFLFYGLLDSHIDLDENGDPADGSFVWTATARGDGGASFPNCLDWITDSEAEMGRTGFTGDAVWPVAGHIWSQFEIRFCDQPSRIYCFEQ